MKRTPDKEIPCLLNQASGCGQDQWAFSQQGQIIGYISGCAAKFLFETVNYETDIKNMDFFGQNMVLEFSRKIHYPIVGQ
jgi:hypothetical protein